MGLFGDAGHTYHSRNRPSVRWSNLNLQTAGSGMTAPERFLFGPGPSNPHPEVLAAMCQPMVGHLDPYFLEKMDETRLQFVSVLLDKTVYLTDSVENLAAARGLSQLFQGFYDF